MAGKTNTGLGRGLDELFGGSDLPTSEGPVFVLDINTIEPSPDQPRKRFDADSLNTLAESIKLHGVITPLTVRKTSQDRYRIIAGERRYRASRMAGLTELPVIVLEADDLQAMEMGLVENLQREDLNPIEEAEGFRALIERFDMTQDLAAQRVGRSRPAVTNSLRLLELSTPVKELIVDGSISAGHGRALLSLGDEMEQLVAAERIIARSLSVRQTEALIKRLKSSGTDNLPSKPDDIDYAGELSKKLSAHFGRRVKVVSNSKNRGYLSLDFYDLNDLDTLIKTISGLNVDNL